jgi:hypothetical protein
MEYVQIRQLEDPLFVQMHEMMGLVFPKEEVLAFELWREPLQDPGIQVFVAVYDGQVVGATEYRYYSDMQVAMTDFTIIGREGLGVGPFLARERAKHLSGLAADSGKPSIGMFAEIYDPYRVEQSLEFGGVKAMNPFVRREVLAHLGYKRLDFAYVHPSWELDGSAVSGLDLCFMPTNPDREALPSGLVTHFLRTYYSALPMKPQEWHEMMASLENMEQVALRPL